MQKIKEYIDKLTFPKIALIIFAVGFFVYGNTLINDLFWDDNDNIVNNIYIREWKYFPNYFSENLTAGVGTNSNYWRPLLLISYAVDYSVGKLSPSIYHFQNLLWHIFSAILIYLIFLRISKNKTVSILTSVLFLVHPLQVEAVSYAAGRADPMYTALMLLSFLFFQKFQKSENIKTYSFSLFFFALSLLSKERAVVFPFIISAYLFLDIYKEKVLSLKKKILLLSPYFFLALGYGILRLTVLHFSAVFDLGQPNNIGASNFYYQTLAYLKGLTVYAKLLIWPAKLYMEKSVSTPNSFFSFYPIFGAVLIIISVWGIFVSVRKKKFFAFGLFWFFAALLPSLQIFPIQGLLYEHWLYFPLIGLFFPISFFIVTNWEKTKIQTLKILIPFFVIAVIFSLSIRTIIRNKDWSTAIEFYEKNISLGGFSSRVYTNLGMSYAETGKQNEAIAYYKKAIELEPLTFQAWYDMGNSNRDSGNSQEAKICYSKTTEINPYFFPAYYNLAGIYAKENQFDKATETMKKALDLNPQNGQTLLNLGIIYYQKGDKNEARDYLKKALNLNPDNQDLKRLINSL